MQLFPRLIVTLLVVISSLAHADNTEWTLKQDENAVKTYTRNDPVLGFQVKIETSVNASPLALLQLLDDTDNGPRWIANARKIDIIEWFGQAERTVHTYFKSPWPFNDRDMVTHSTATWLIPERHVRIQIRDVGDQHALLPHYVRMHGVKGQWDAQLDAQGLLNIQYVGSANAGGMLPEWIANKMMATFAHQTFVALRENITRPVYQQQITE
ncbi:hypothetical protein LJ739_06585 [Aestuariibacter halophilus]|uniref:START domain-containing protein n=1 Tax=Fluctibacter halophilus TaxID=226011 RepID=A0ABS8G5M8_9ALTE|nr:START domain-containing protein [Aestuariibacter halophilus]MCC2615902.1 hypothetical protein [Aestuariibacter halophilus]